VTNPLVLQAELLDIIKGRADNAPRSLQRELGPSEVGDPCERKLAFKLHGMEPASVGKGGDKWRATVGTAIHSWLEDAFGQHSDYITERKVVVGAWYDGEKARVLQGSCDLFRISSGTVLDFKTTSQAKMADYARGKISETYRTQIHLYGLGYRNAGHDVKQVGLVFLPRDDDLNLSTSVLYVEDFDPSIAEAALKRLERIAETSKNGDFASLATASSFCSRCSWFASGSTKPDSGRCPGVFTSKGLDASNPFNI
jgi:hypothetical protein